ncbi:MAG: hypothetical protein C0395_04760 [Gemmatimonas sp.]|nr:hypothetical protein [Gemmatimonas sp.]
MAPRTGIRIALAAGLALLAGCAPGTTHFLRTDVDLSFVRRCAVVPFHNLSADRFAAARLQPVFLAELLQTEALQVVDPGATQAACNRLGLGPDTTLTPEQIVALGEALDVQTIFTGTVEEYGQRRSGGDQVYALTATFSMSETETGTMVWNAQVSRDGSSFWRKLFGGDSASQFDVSRRAVHEALESLF